MSDNGDLRTRLTHLLSNVRDGKEIRAYLQKFADSDEAHFAVIKIGGAGLRDDLEAIAENLALLHAVGLKPIVVHGAGPQLDAALRAAGVDTPRIEGLRATPHAAMPIVCDTTLALSLDLVAAIRKFGGNAVPAPASVVTAAYIDRERLGAVGNPLRTDTDKLNAIIRSGSIPVLASLGQTLEGQVVNINGDAVVRQTALALNPLKIVFVSGVGGLLDRHGRIINAINLESDYEGIAAGDWVNAGMRVKIDEIRRLLYELPRSSSASITSASGLVRELFTHGGAGTLVRRGEGLATVTRLADVDRDRAGRLIATAFGRSLRPDFWDSLDFHSFYISESYRCGALLSRIGEDILLDKFAVAPDARGEGLSRAIWRRMRHDEPRFFWRARRDNQFNVFYYQAADGFVRAGDWNVFWVGETLPGDAGMIARIAEKPDSFEEGGPQ